jgi:hypothetical protein
VWLGGNDADVCALGRMNLSVVSRVPRGSSALL